VIDIVPTILEAAGLPHPVTVDGVAQTPLEGVSMVYSFNDANAPDQHETQYFEMFGNRGIYHKGWTAVTRHATPWILQGAVMPAFDDDVWELYDTTKDWSQANDLSKANPEKLHELQRLWLIEAVKYDVLPLDDNVGARMDSDRAGRPVLVTGDSQVLLGGMGRLGENCVLNMKNKSHSVTAELVIPDDKPANGVIIAQGANIGGWSLYAKDGKLKYCYNLGGIKSFFVESDQPIPSGEQQVRMEFTYDGGALAKGGDVALFIAGQPAGKGRVDATLPVVFSADDGCDIGCDNGAPVSSDYGPTGNSFNGTVKGVQLAIKDDAKSADHLVTAEQALAVAMARQ
jgi:arylsulfatase